MLVHIYFFLESISFMLPNNVGMMNDYFLIT